MWKIATTTFDWLYPLNKYFDYQKKHRQHVTYSRRVNVLLTLHPIQYNFFCFFFCLYLVPVSRISLFGALFILYEAEIKLRSQYTSSACEIESFANVFACVRLVMRALYFDLMVLFICWFACFNGKITLPSSAYTLNSTVRIVTRCGIFEHRLDLLSLIVFRNQYGPILRYWHCPNNQIGWCFSAACA